MHFCFGNSKIDLFVSLFSSTVRRQAWKLLLPAMSLSHYVIGNLFPLKKLVACVVANRDGTDKRSSCTLE